ncbi:MAG TPA: M1 family metallopeptidase, partial [Planctomycetota bacterium]|nr:M1 family metallopeptidase [Planctomycetota bacterium]
MTETHEHRLPTNVVPRAYRLTLEPDLQTFTFAGEVAIDLDVRQATTEVVLHSVDLAIQSASLGEVRMDPARERATVVAREPLKPGPATLTLRFTGTLNDKMRGFYRSTYTRPDGSKGVMATTQFESTSARHAFPCFDEPALKATFEVTLVVPRALAAISNMPIVAEEDSGSARRRVRFAPSPVMPTYLLAFIVGEFESIQATTRDGVQVRVFSTPGRVELCRFALETAVRGLEFFGGYYGIPYRNSIPKCDLIAVPDFEYGAMENWGAITFRETAIFVDPKKSSVPQRRRVAEVVLHELAHQWFGNLVSPEWWSYLWLNESFATFMAYKAEHALFPEWRVWEEYLAAITSAGKSLDSLRSSHPVEVIVRDPNEVDQIFDAISYNKGGSVLWMLEQSMGEEAFRKGVAKYLETHAYGNAGTDDLWGAMGGEVPRMMDGWTRRVGWPVVHARREPGTLALRQERFFLEGPAPDPTVWDIPLSWVSSGGRGSARLSSREGSLAAPAGWLKLNAGQSGFYLVNYDEQGWRELAGALGSLAAPDRFGLQEDAYSLLRAGYVSLGSYLTLARAFGQEENHHVWAGLAGGLGALGDIFHGLPGAGALEALARGLLSPVAARVGWEEKGDEGHERLLLRSTVLGAAVSFSEPLAVAEAKRRFQDPARLSPNLRSTVFFAAARHGEDSALDLLIGLYEKADLPEVKVQLLRAMGAFRREAPLRRALAYSLSDKVRLQDAMFAFGSAPMEAKPIVWELFKEHFPTIDARYGKSGLIGQFVSSAAGGIPSETHAADVETFFRSHPVPYATEKLKLALEGIRAR